MSLLRSLVNSSFSGIDDISGSIHELQTRRQQVPELPPPISHTKMSNFSPPAPVSASLYLSRPTIRAPELAREPENLLALHREEKNIEYRLQQLLDAQAEGLMAGLTGEGGSAVEDDILSTGSSTPTVSSPQSRRQSHASNRSSVLPLHPRKKVNLRGARKGIAKAMQRLANIKAAEVEILSRHLEDNQMVLERINGWEVKRMKLEQKIDTIERSDSRSRREELQDEADKLQTEINKLEQKLRGMKARHRELLEEAAATENSVQAKLSSYKSALAMLQSDVNEFLRRPPTPEVPPHNSSFFTLPPKRRTLGLAREEWSEQRETLEDEFMRVEVNKEALEEGLAAWDEVISTVTRFEASLRQEMMKAVSDDPKGKQKASSSLGPDNIFSQMDEVIAKLEEGQKRAEAKNWRLLVCSIGAELEAFKQGRDMFREALGLEEAAADGDVESNAQPSSQSNTSRSGSEDLEETAKAWRRDRIFDASDDEPDPHLLIAQRDTDTD